MAALIGLYSGALVAFPLATKSLSAAFVMAGADFGSQKYEGHAIDTRRLFRVAVFAAFVGAPALHFWYMILEALFPGTGTRSVMGKVLLDNFLFTPLSILVFFVFLGLSEGHGWERVRKEVEKSFFPTLRTALMVWPFASCINFLFVPENFRPIFIGALSVVWNGYLSFVKHRTETPILPLTISPPMSPSRSKHSSFSTSKSEGTVNH